MISNEELNEIEKRAEQATLGPWFVETLDDNAFMTLIAVTHERPSEKPKSYDAGVVVAATLVQHPRYVSTNDQRFDENAAFIAASRTDVVRLVAEVRRLRSLPTDSQI